MFHRTAKRLQDIFEIINYKLYCNREKVKASVKSKCSCQLEILSHHFHSYFFSFCCLYLL